MADDGKWEELGFTIDELNLAFKEFPDGESCPVCASPDWLSAFGDNWCTGLVYSRADGSIGFGSIPVVAVTCKRCGYVRQHALGKLRELVKEIRDR